jgi:hypothetical protein
VRPTVGDELSGVRRILQDVASEPALAPDAVAALGDACAILARVEKYWSKVLPYLLADTSQLTAVLQEISPALPADLQQDIQALVAEQGAYRDVTIDFARADDLEQTARSLVSRAIAALPADPPGQGGPLARVRSALASSLEERPW